MTPAELDEQQRRLELIAKLKHMDAAGVARTLKSASESECATIARHADEIGQRGVGKVVWDLVRKMG